jgi:tetratricopeptide (TPR) repeat protein
MRRWLALALLPAGAALLLVGRLTASQVTATAFLDRYAAGQFDAVVDELSGDLDFEALVQQFKRDAPGWIDAGGPERREQRELVVVTFALEAARADQWHAWKLIWLPPAMTPGGLRLPSPLGNPAGGAPGGMGGGAPYQPFPILRWQPGPQFIEWACERLRRDKTPRPIERWWQLAALAVAQRSEDVHFLVGDPNIGRGTGAGEIGNLQDEIKHLDHVTERFPGEPRFMLAQGIARPQWPDDAVKAFTAVLPDEDVGGEAAMRLGALEMRLNQRDEALHHFEQVEELTRDPYVIYLARFFTGQIRERQRRIDDATAAYRGAVAAWPHAQAGTMALASLLFDAGRRVEAQTLAGAMLAARPPVRDPWREFVHADNRFWPVLVGRLRAEIRK